VRIFSSVCMCASVLCVYTFVYIRVRACEDFSVNVHVYMCASMHI